MLQLAKLTIFILLAISYVNCDDHSDLMKEVKELMKDMPDAPDMSSFISSTQPTEAVNWTELTTLLAQTHDPTMDSDDKRMSHLNCQQCCKLVMFNWQTVF